MIHLSKSKYCQLWQCPKMAWLTKHKPELQVISENTQARFDTGNEVGDLAMGLFGDFVEVTTYNEEGKLDLVAMMERTKEEMAKGTPVICEGALAYGGLYCAVDILKKEGDGYAIYEVKSSTTSEKKNTIKPVYLADISYQKYVLEQCGVHVTGTYLVTLNGDYVRGDELEVDKLFKVIDVSELMEEEYNKVEGMLAVGEKVIPCEEEPDISISGNCHSPYDCAYIDYCMRHIPKPSVFDIANMNFNTKIKLYSQGIITYQQLIDNNVKLSDKQSHQVNFELNDCGTFIDGPKIKEFIDTLSYPIYFFDFETMQSAIPMIPGTKPYQQLTFQYSLHYIEEEGGELKHKEFLAPSGEDPRRAIAEAICRDIPKDVCVTAYNMGFEKGRIRELADAFPDLAEHLLNIEGNIKDLMVPFQSGYYYNKAMDGAYTIKKVLPALFPDDPSLDYHNLEGVQNGGDAMTIYPKLKDMPPEEQEKIIHSLLKYCELDTYALVKVWEKLVECCKDKES